MGNQLSRPQHERTIGVEIPYEFGDIPIEFQTKHVGLCNTFVATWRAFTKPSIWNLLRWKFWTENRSNIPWNKPEEPPQELEKQMYNKHLDPKTFFNLRIGETWIVGDDRDYDPPFMEREKTGTPGLNNGPGDLGATASGELTTEAGTEDWDYGPPFMEREKTGTPRLNNGPGNLEATGSNQHVGKDEKVEASGELTTEAGTEDWDYGPPFMEREKNGTPRLNNDPGDLGATGSNQHVSKDEKVEASGVLTNEAGGEDRDYDPPFMERGITGTLSLNNGQLDGGLGCYIWKPALSECENYHLHRIDRFCQDIKMESRGKQTERSNPRQISPDQPWPHNNQKDSVTGMKPTVHSTPRSMALDALWTHNNQKHFINGMKSTGRSKPRSVALDAPWTHNNQEDSTPGMKPTGRSTTRSMAFDAPWTHNSQEDSTPGMKPTGRSKPRRSLSPDESSQRNQDSASSIKATGRSARD